MCCCTTAPKAPFCGGLLGNKEDGVYCCQLCGLPLFRSPHQVRERHRLAELLRTFEGRPRRRSCVTSATAWCAIETRCARCDSHQGHVFPDGPAPDPPALLHRHRCRCSS